MCKPSNWLKRGWVQCADSVWYDPKNLYILSLTAVSRINGSNKKSQWNFVLVNLGEHCYYVEIKQPCRSLVYRSVVESESFDKLVSIVLKLLESSLLKHSFKKPALLCVNVLSVYNYQRMLTLISDVPNFENIVKKCL